MSTITILNVAIGLVFTWFVLSLAAMYGQEWISSKFKWRSGMLESSIRNMLSDGALADQLYNHPLIRSLFTGEGNVDKPAYIPSSQFAQALMDIVSTAGMEASLIQEQIYKLYGKINVLGKRKRGYALKRLNLIQELNRKALNSDAEEEVVDDTLKTIYSEISKLKNDYPKLKPAVDTALETIRKQKKDVQAAILGVQNQGRAYSKGSTSDRIHIGLSALGVTHPDLRQSLNFLLREEESTKYGGDMVSQIQKNIEDWFNNCMDRLSGWYKRRTQAVLSVIGIVLALISNTDSISLVNQLWHDSVVRNNLAVQAEAYNNQNLSAQDSGSIGQVLSSQGQLLAETLPIGWIGTPFSINQDGVAEGISSPEYTCTPTPKGGSDIFGFPIAGECYPLINTPQKSDMTGWLIKMLGLIVTALAVAQGAPFWFDMLKKIINVRSSGLIPGTKIKVAG